MHIVWLARADLVDDTIDLFVRQIRALGDLTLVGLSGEVVVDYVTMLEHALGPKPLWVAAYCNDVFGY